jgi:hypothetical protein
MAETSLKIWYDKDIDILEGFLGDEANAYAATENDQVLADVDLERDLQGSQIEGVTQLGDALLDIPVPTPDNLKRSGKP